MAVPHRVRTAVGEAFGMVPEIEASTGLRHRPRATSGKADSTRQVRYVRHRSRAEADPRPTHHFAGGAFPQTDRRSR